MTISKAEHKRREAKALKELLACQRALLMIREHFALWDNWPMPVTNALRRFFNALTTGHMVDKDSWSTPKSSSSFYSGLTQGTPK